MTDELRTEVVLSAKDNLTPTLDRVGHAFNKLHSGSQKFMASLGGFAKSALFSAAGAAGIGYGFKALANQIVGSQQELEKLQKDVTGVQFGFQGWKDGISTLDRLRIAGEEAREQLEKMGKVESRLAMPAAELAQSYKMLAGPIMGEMGKSGDDVMRMVTKSAEMSKVFGQSAVQMGMVVSRALSLGVVVGRDPLSLHLKSALGNMQKLTKAQRFAKIEKELSGYGEAAEKMSNSFSDMMFRIKNFFGDTIRDVAGPTFKYIVARIEEWRVKLTQTTDGGKKIVDVYGDKLLNAFKALEKITATLFDHWKEIAFLIGGLKLGDLAGSAAAGAGGMLAGFTGPLEAVGAKLAQFAPQLAGAVAGLGAFASALTWIVGEIDKWQGKEIEASGKAEGLSMLLEKNMNAQQMSKVARSLGYVDDKGNVNKALIERGFSQFDDERLKKYSRVLGGAMGLGETSDAGKIAGAFAEMIRTRYIMPVKTPEKAVEQISSKDAHKPKTIQNFHGGITIKQDFKDADPDRVFIRFKEDLARLGENRVQSSEAEAFG